MFGLLNINKPPGKTSRDVVNHVQRIVRPVKVGHAGTLDPLATGVLVLCLGPATRLIEYVQRMPKCYSATFVLGRRSDTEDVDGEVTEIHNAPQPTQDQFVANLPLFMGEIEQRPPAYSAVKIKGKRAYQLARAGHEVSIPARNVTIYKLELLQYAYPDLTIQVECGSGTYIRSLGRDLAESLGSGAVLSSLVRTAIGDFTIDNALELEHVSADSISKQLQPATHAVTNLRRTELTDDEVRRIGHGLVIDNRLNWPDTEIAAIDSTGKLVAILTPKDSGQLRPLRVFPAS